MDGIFCVRAVSWECHYCNSWPDEKQFPDSAFIDERGGFDELMALDGHFARIYKIQMTQEGSVNFDALADSIAEGRA